MLEFLALDDTTILGAFVTVLVLAFLRFGDAFVDRVLLYRSSSVEAIEKSIPEGE